MTKKRLVHPGQREEPPPAEEKPSVAEGSKDGPSWPTTTSVGPTITYAPTINVSVNVDGRRISTSMRSPRQSQASSLGSFDLVSEDEEF